MTRSGWEEGWARVWRATVAHAGREVNRLHDEIPHTANGSPEREALLREIVGPSWEDEFGRAALQDPAYVEWERSGMDAFMASFHDTHREMPPERRDVDALVRAWRAGLTKIVTIPCRGEHTRVVRPNALLVTDLTRADSDGYRRALSSFT